VRPPSLVLARRRLGRAWLWCKLALKALTVRVDRRRRNGSAGVVLVAHSLLSAQYVVEVGRVLSKNLNVRVAIASPAGLEFDSEFETVSPRTAAWRWWDLAVFADHDPLRFSLKVPSMIVLHGMVRSRQVREGSYQYDRRRILRLGRPVYDVMGDASEASKAWASHLVPEVASRIQVLGDLRADEMLRKARSLPSALPRIIVMSTWGPHSLMERHGTEALKELRTLAAEGWCEVTITTHPRLWTRSDRPWQRVLQELSSLPGVRVLAPGAEWEAALGWASVALSDHTSLVGVFSLLRRPMVLASVDDKVVGEGTLASVLYANCPVVSDWSELRTMIESAIAAPLPAAVGRAVDDILSCPGEAEVRTVGAAKSLLDGYRG